MAISYTKRYSNLSDQLYDYAKNTTLFDENTYKKAFDEGTADEYAAVLLDVNTRTSSSFDKAKYDMFDADTKYAYLMNEFYGDKNSDTYKKNAAYFDDAYVKAVNKQEYEAMNWLQKAGKTVGGMFSNAWMSVAGLAEGLINATLFVASAGTAKPWIEQDTLGYAKLQKELSLDYSGIDANKFLKMMTDVSNGIVRMTPLIAGYAFAPVTGGASVGAGKLIYYGSMLGNSAEEAIKANPDIAWGNLVGYSLGSVVLEAGIESISDKLGGSLFGGKGAGKGLFAQIGIDFASEAGEEMASEITSSLLYQWTVDPNAPTASIQDILYAGLIGGLTGVILSGGKVLTTSRLAVDENGNLIRMKDARAMGMEVDKKNRLSKLQSYNALSMISSLDENINKSSVIKLQEKYSDLSLNEIKTQHADEYKTAAERDAKTDKQYVKTLHSLSNILKTIGEKNFTKALDVLNYGYEKAATLMDNFKNNETAHSVEAKAAQLLFSKSNPGMNIQISEDLTKIERRIKDWLKAEANIDTFFGAVGSENGVDPGQIITTGNNIFIQQGIFDTMSMDQVLNTVVKRKIVDNVMQDMGKASPKWYSQVMNIVNETADVDYGKLTEDQKRTITQMLLYDPLTIGKTFERDKTIFQKVYDAILKWLGINRQNKQNKEYTKLEFAALLKARNEYINIAADSIGNYEDAETLKRRMNMTDEQYETLLKNKFLPSILNEYYVLANDNNHQDTVNRKRLIKELLLNRVETDLTAPIDWENIENEEYFVNEFIEKVKRDRVETEWKDALWGYIYDNYNLVMSVPNESFYGKIDLVEQLKTEVRSELNDAIISNDIAYLLRLTNLNQFFENEFLNRFKNLNAEILWNKTSSMSTTARTISTKNGIKIEVFVGRNMSNLQTVLMHEAAHVLALHQGMPFGTSQAVMSAALRENASEDTIRGLADMVLTKDTRDWTLDQITEAVAFQMYMMSKGEVYAQGDPKAYAKFKDGFIVTDSLVFGIGRFSRVNGMPLMIKLSKTTGKEAAIDAVDNAGGDLAGWLVEKGFSDPAKAGFSEQAIELIGNAHKGDLWQLFLSPPEMSDVKTNKPKQGHINGVGTEQANNLLIAFLKPENKYITTIKKAITAQKYYELSVPFIAISKKFNKNHKANQPYSMSLVRDRVFSDKYLNKTVTDTFFEKGKAVTVLQLIETTTKTLDSYAHKHPANTGVLIELIDLDFDFSENKTKELFKDLAQGLDSSKDSLFVTGVVKSESGELTEQADLNEDETIETPDTYVENLGTEDEDNTLAGLTMEDIQQMSVEDLRKTANDWVTNVGTSTPQGFSVADRIDKPMAKNRLKKLIGEDKYNTLQNELGVLRKSNIEDRIKTAKKRLARVSALTNTEQTLLETDTSEYKTPLEFLYYEEMMNIASKKALVKAVNAQKRKLNNMGDLTKEQQKLLDTDTREFSLTKYENLLKKLTIETAKASKPIKEVTKKATEAAKVKKEAVKKETVEKIEKTVEKAAKVPEKLKINEKSEAADVVEQVAIETTKNLDVADKILALLTRKRMSELKRPGETDQPEKANVVGSEQIIRENYAVFLELNDKNINEIKQKLYAINTEESRVAIELIDFHAYTNANSPRFESISKEVIDTHEEEVRKAGLKMYLWSTQFEKSHSTKALVNDLSKAEIDTTTQSEEFAALLQQYDNKLADKDAYIKELQDKVAETESIITAMAKEKEQDLVKQSELVDKLKTINDFISILKNGDNVDIADWLIEHADDLRGRAEIQSKVFEHILNNVVLAKQEGKEVGTFTYKDKNGQPIAFPEFKKKLNKFASILARVRYGAMLSSPITWVRNYTNNQLMYALGKATDWIERGINKLDFYQKGYADPRQFQLLAGKEDVAFTNYLTDNYYDFIFDWLGGTKNKMDVGAAGQQVYEAKRKVVQETGTAIAKALSKIESVIYKNLETGKLGDRPILTKSVLSNLSQLITANKSKFISELRQQYGSVERVKNNGNYSQTRKDKIINALETQTTEAVFEAVALDSARFDAILNTVSARSLEQFFKNDNRFSKLLRNLSDSSPTAKFLIGIINPFYKVGSNVLAMAYKYSPLNFINAIAKLNIAHQVTAEGYSGKVKGTEVAETARAFSQATTGTVLLITGLLAAAIGLIDIDDDDYMGPSLNFLGYRLGLANLAPALTTLSVGASIVDAAKNDKNLITNVTDVLYSNTLLGNVDNLFKYSSSTKFFENLSINYVTSYIPAVVKLTQRVTDPNTKDKSGNYLDKLLKNIGASIPGLSYAVPNKINPYTGENVTRYSTDNFIRNLLAAINPLDSSYSYFTKSELQLEAERLSTKTSGLSGSFKINGKDVALTGTEKTKYAKYRADYIEEQYELIVSGKQKVNVKTEKGTYEDLKWDKLTDEQKTNVLENLYSTATNNTKIKYWVDSGNVYKTGNKEEYDRLRKLLKSSQIKYQQGYKKSKFIEV